MRSLWIVPALLLVAVVTGSPAQAANSGATVVKKQTIHLVVTGFDAAVARANGYPTMRPDNVVPGNCGTSFIYIYNGNKDPYTGQNFGGRGYGYNTGYTVINSVASFKWHVIVTGPSWSKNDYDPGHATGKSWTGHNHWAVPNAGQYVAQVVTISTATLVDGRVCNSVGPFDEVNVT